MISKLHMTRAAAIVLALASMAVGMRADKPDDDNNDQDGKGGAPGTCASLPNYGTLKAALAAATATETSGLNNQMWATIVDRDGIVCAVAFTGVNRGAQWPGSRVISAQKANTAN